MADAVTHIGGEDRVVHAVAMDEDERMYGATKCGLFFTQTPSAAITSIFARTTAGLSCLICLRYVAENTSYHGSC